MWPLNRAPSTTSPAALALAALRRKTGSTLLLLQKPRPRDTLRLLTAQVSKHMAKLKRQAKKIIVLTLASIFFVLGIAGSVLPVLQGWLFFAISAILFSMYSPRLRAWIEKHSVKYPKLHAVIGKANDWTAKVFGAPEV